MTRQEVGRKYCISEGILRQYEDMGLLQCTSYNSSGEPQYENKDISLLGFIQSLREMGMEVNTLKRYFTLRRSPTDTREEQVRLLREHRAKLLESLHDQREMLEQLDYLIYQTERGGKTDEQKL